jgi:dihydrofolate reductase
MTLFLAIAAMSFDRVIGRQGRIPWHLPEDFRWFKRRTMGQVLVMGRKTFEAIGRVLPGRETIVLTRSGWSAPGILTAPSLDALPLSCADPREVFICGGAEVYAAALPRCRDLYLTRVKFHVAGDAYFPPFEESFALVETLQSGPQFDILHYRNLAMAGATGTPEAPLGDSRPT